MKDLYCTLAFFMAASGTFRLIYGSWPPTSSSFFQWLSSDGNAKWAMGAGILAGMFASAIVRWLSGTPRPQDPRLEEASECVQRGVKYHEERRTDEAAGMFQRAIAVCKDCGSDADSAQAYASLGKLYFDTGELDLAESHLKEGRIRFQQSPGGRNAVTRIDALLQLISERRTAPKSDTRYADPVFRFSLTIPAGWVKQPLVDEFARTGGRLAISHISHAATFNVSVAPPDRPEWLSPDARTRAAREYVQKIPFRTGPVEVVNPTPIGGESNVVVIEYDTQAPVGGVFRRRKNCLISVVHKGIEYALQWSAQREHEESARGIIKSFALTGVNNSRFSAAE